MKFNIFWKRNSLLFHTVWWLFDISGISGWWKGSSRKVWASDIFFSPTQGWDVCTVWWSLRTSQTLWLHNFQSKDEHTPPHICISTARCHFSISLSHSLSLSVSKKDVILCLLCLISPEWWFKHWHRLFERFSSTCLYSAVALMQSNGQNTASSRFVCFVLFLICVRKMKIIIFNFKGLEQKESTINGWRIHSKLPKRESTVWKL